MAFEQPKFSLKFSWVGARNIPAPPPLRELEEDAYFCPDMIRIYVADRFSRQKMNAATRPPGDLQVLPEEA